MFQFANDCDLTLELAFYWAIRRALNSTFRSEWFLFVCSRIKDNPFFLK